MTTEVAVDAIQLEAPRIASNPVSLLKHRDAGDPFSGKLVGRAHAGRACAENHHVLCRRRARVP